MFTISVRHKDACTRDVPPDQLRRWLKTDRAVVWVDVEAHTDEDLAFLQECFGFHGLAIEDVRNSHQRPKIDLYDHYAFVVFYSAEVGINEEKIDLQEIEMFVGPNYMVTIHDGPNSDLQGTHERWEQNVVHINEDIGTLMYSILDTIMDGYFPVLDWVSDEIDRLENCVFEEFDQSLLRDTLQLKRDLLGLRRVVGPHREVINRLLRGETDILPTAATPFLQDLYDHALRVVEAVDIYREMVTSVTDGFLSVQSNNINVVVQRLTILNLLFLPLTVLTGFFGMNFDSIPFASPALFGAALLAMVLFPAALFFLLRRRGWG